MFLVFQDNPFVAPSFNPKGIAADEKTIFAD
jgi:hypothetical protein